jgi:hypothetical protein
MKKLSFAVILGIIALFVAGCGSGGSGSSNNTTGKNDIPEIFRGNYDFAAIYDEDYDRDDPYIDGVQVRRYQVGRYVVALTVSSNQISWNGSGKSGSFTNVSSSNGNDYSGVIDSHDPEYSRNFYGKYYYLYSDGKKIGIATHYIIGDDDPDVEIWLGKEAKESADYFLIEYNINMNASDIANNVVWLYGDKY